MSDVATISGSVRSDTEKFLRCFMQKFVQIIVQSRQGDRKKEKCFPDQNLWFCVPVSDDKEINHKAKEATNSEIIGLNKALIVEISLKTFDGEDLSLEIWTLSMSEPCDNKDVYTNLSRMLHTLLTVSRVIPVYKMSREQGPETFVILYQIYMGESNKAILGEGYRDLKVASLGTPIGTVHLGFSYRTKMTISPDRSTFGGSIMMKSDHFRLEYSPKLHKHQRVSQPPSPKLSESPKHYVGDRAKNLPAIQNTEEKEVDFLMGKLTTGAFATFDTFPETGEEEELVAPFNALFLNNSSSASISKKDTNDAKEIDKDSSANRCPSSTEKTVPVITNVKEMSSELHRSTDSNKSMLEDFLMVETNAPFAESDPVAEVNFLLKECCKSPTMLNSFSDHNEVNILDKLKDYETDLIEFDSFVKSMDENDENST